MRLLKYSLIIILCFSLFFVYNKDNFLTSNFEKISYYNVPVYVDKDIDLSNVLQILDNSKKFNAPNEIKGLKSIIFLEKNKIFRFNDKPHSLGWYSQQYKTIYIVYNLHKNNFSLLHTFEHEMAHHYDLTIEGNIIDGNQETRAENIVINKMF